MKLFVSGLLTGIVVTIVGAMVFVKFWTSPALDVEVNIPVSAKVKQPFEIIILLNNPHDKIATLGNVDVPNNVLELFSVESTGPLPSEDSPVDGFGSNTWYFDIDVQPSSTQNITFEVTPLITGRHILEFEVCNATEDCTQIVRSIEVM